MLPATSSGTVISTNEKTASLEDEQLEQFRKDVIEGLSGPEKSIPSKYFYDATGDRLFQQIMRSPDYYLTRCENEIFRTQNSALTRVLAEDKGAFNVIELGAGDGTKTMHLIKKWLSRDQRPRYMPVDISANVLEILGSNMIGKFPSLPIVPLQGGYFKVLEDLPVENGAHKVFLFLGSSIGNMDRLGAIELLRRIGHRMEPGDRLLVGFDLKKDPAIIRRAYNDRAGVTRQFNFNLLHRMNMELGADLHLDQFSHEPIYDPMRGKAMSFMVSKQDQVITIPGAPVPIHLKAWEAIQTESSHKYDMPLIGSIAADAGMQMIDVFTDKKKYFADVVMALDTVVR